MHVEPKTNVLEKLIDIERAFFRDEVTIQKKIKGSVVRIIFYYLIIGYFEVLKKHFRNSESKTMSLIEQN